jgi:serine/threonine-protein kinase HipA
MEKLVTLIDKFCTFPSIEKIVLFKIVIFNYITGNDDMHLKNFSIITENEIVRLSPCYDLLNTFIEYSKPEDEIALPLNGKKKHLTQNLLIKYYGIERCGLTVKSVDKVLDTINTAFLHG